MNIIVLNIIVCVSLAFVLRIIPIKKRARQIVFLVTSFLLLVIVHCIVSPLVPVDIPEYELSFNTLRDDSHFSVTQLFSEKEPFFYLSLKLSSLISDSFNFYLVLYSVFFVFCYYFCIVKYSPNWIVSILFFLLILFNQSMYVLRQVMAMAIILFSYKYILKRDFVRTLLITIIAMQFHLSAVVFIPCVFLYSIKSNRAYLFATIILSFVFILVFDILFHYFGSTTFSAYDIYLNSDHKINSTRALIITTILALYVIVLKKKCFEEGVNKLVLTLLIFGAVGAIAGTGFSQTDRLFEYYSTSSFLAIPITYSYFKNRVIAFLYIVIAFILFYYVAFHGFDQNVLNIPALQINI